MSVETYLPGLIEHLAIREAYEAGDVGEVRRLLLAGGLSRWQSLCGLANAVSYARNSQWGWVAQVAAEVKGTLARMARS